MASLVADPDDLFGGRGIYSNPSLREERVGSIAFFDGEDGFSLDCGVKIHGATSRFAQRKKSLKLNFRSRYDGELNYDLFENGVTTFSSVLLRAAQEDTFSTHMRDVFMHQLAIKCFPTLLAQDYKYTVLYINGEYWGVYAFREAHSADSYANLETELAESVELLSRETLYKAAALEQVTHLTDAVQSLKAA